MTERMEYQITVDHFYVLDSVAVFPAGLLGNFPEFVSKAGKLGHFKLTKVKDSIVFAAVRSPTLITPETFDQAHVDGYAVVNARTKTIDVLLTQNNKILVKHKLLDKIIETFEDELYVRLDVNSKNLEDDSAVYSKYGFIDPDIDKDNEYITLKYVKRIKSYETLTRIKDIINSIRNDKCVLKLFIPIDVAEVLSKCVKFMYESAGNLSISKYTENGIAVVSINSDHIVEGTKHNVHLPKEYSPIVFHSHPDHATRELEAYIMWPSGLDMRTITGVYMGDKDQLVHFVVSPEGMWAVHISIAFQRMLMFLKRARLYDCANEVIERIKDVFGGIENVRGMSINPIERHKAELFFSEKVKKYTIGKLAKDVPSLIHVCHAIDPNSKDAPLFDTELIKWKRFDEYNGVYLSYDYVPDTQGGLPPFIQPYN